MLMYMKDRKNESWHGWNEPANQPDFNVLFRFPLLTLTLDLGAEVEFMFFVFCIYIFYCIGSETDIQMCLWYLNLCMILPPWPLFEKRRPSPLLVSGEGPVRLHQEGDRGFPAVCAGVPTGEAADSTLQPSDGCVGSDWSAHAAGGAHTHPQAQTLGAEGVLCQGLCRCRTTCGWGDDPLPAGVPDV